MYYILYISFYKPIKPSKYTRTENPVLSRSRLKVPHKITLMCNIINCRVYFVLASRCTYEDYKCFKDL